MIKSLPFESGHLISFVRTTRVKIKIKLIHGQLKVLPIRKIIRSYVGSDANKNNIHQHEVNK